MRRVVSKFNRECCPACGREFGKISDYPRVEVLAFERLPLPEAFDQFSSAASEFRARAFRTGREDAWNLGVNVTPKLADACSEQRVVRYLDGLQNFVGREISPSELTPSWQADGYFSFAFPLNTTTTNDRSSRGNRLYLGIAEPDDADDGAEPSASGECYAHVVIYGDGINFGSGGGPTLQCLGVIARLRYRGLLKPEFRDSKSERSVQ